MKDFTPPKELIGFPVIIADKVNDNSKSITFGDFHKTYGEKKFKIENSES